MTGPRRPKGSAPSARRRPRVAGQPAGRRPADSTGRPRDAAESELPSGVDDSDTAAPDTAAAAPVAATTSPTSVDDTPAVEDSGDTEPEGVVDAEPADDFSPAAEDDVETPAAGPPETETAGAPRGKQRRPAARVATIKPNRPGGVRPDDRPSRPVGRRRRTRTLGWGLVGVIAAVALVVGAIAATAAVQPGVSLSSNQAFVDSAVTSEVTSQAKTRVCSVFAVNYAKLDEWQSTARANLTGEAAKRFDQLAAAVRNSITQSGVTEGGVQCRPDVVGVRTINGDSATLLANVIVSQTQDQQAAGSGTKRYEVTMNRVKGQWLIGNFTDF